jgi:molybdopterin-guanine dinucleotide biosynthesis protein B
MNRVHIVGGKGHGKTTLIVELVGRLGRLGLRVGTIKHTRHAHELDTPGKDSHRHRVAGAVPAAIVAGPQIGCFLPNDPAGDAYRTLAPMFDGCDLVLVEGDVEAAGPKIEVWRREAGPDLLCSDQSEIAAIVTDDDPGPISVPIFPRGDLSALLRFIESHAADACDVTR